MSDSWGPLIAAVVWDADGWGKVQQISPKTDVIQYKWYKWRIKIWDPQIIMVNHHVSQWN